MRRSHTPSLPAAAAARAWATRFETPLPLRPTPHSARNPAAS